MIYKFKKYIVALRKFHRYTTLTFNDYSIYLKPGKYKYDFNYAYFYSKDFNPEKYPDNLFEPRRTKFSPNSLENAVLKISYFILALFSSKSISDRSKNTQYKAELVFNKRGTGFKFFDYNNKKVITIISTLDGLESVNEIKTVNEYFDTAIIDSHKDGRVIIEDWIFEEPFDDISQNDGLELYTRFLNDLNSFVANYDFSDSIKVDSQLLVKNFNWLVSTLPKNTIEKIRSIDVNFPLVHFFSDIGLHNILIKKNKYKMIDYGGFREIFPFTIALSFLVSLSNGTPFKAIYNYKKGSFDRYFQELFSYMKINYDPELKEAYFIYSYLIELHIHQNLVQNKLGKSEKINRIKSRFDAIMKKYRSIKVP